MLLFITIKVYFISKLFNWSTSFRAVQHLQSTNILCAHSFYVSYQSFVAIFLFHSIQSIWLLRSETCVACVSRYHLVITVIEHKKRKNEATYVCQSAPSKHLKITFSIEFTITFVDKFVYVLKGHIFSHVLWNCKQYSMRWMSENINSSVIGHDSIPTHRHQFTHAHGNTLIWFNEQKQIIRSFISAIYV